MADAKRFLAHGCVGVLIALAWSGLINLIGYAAVSANMPQ